MKTRVNSIIVGMGVLMLGMVGLSSKALAQPAWGDTVGPVSAVVERVDTDQGLAVRSGPSPESETLGFLPAGTKINGYNEFTQGWMKLRNPYEGGWVHIDYLVPRGGPAEVISVDQGPGCLNIRSGPDSSYPTVACAPLGEKLMLTGVWSENNWAELAEPAGAWVFAGQIRTALDPNHPSKTRVAQELIYEDEPIPYYDFDEPSVVYNYIYRYPPLYWGDRYYGFGFYDGYWPYGYHRYWPHRYAAYKYWGKRHPKYGFVVGGKHGGHRFDRYDRYGKNFAGRGHGAYPRYRSNSFNHRLYNARGGRNRSFASRSGNIPASVSRQRAVSSVWSGRGGGARVSPRRAAALQANIGAGLSARRSSGARVRAFGGNFGGGSAFRSRGSGRSAVRIGRSGGPAFRIGRSGGSASRIGRGGGSSFRIGRSGGSAFRGGGFRGGGFRGGGGGRRGR